MTKQVINVGTTPNDKKGDSLRAAFQKVNTNFTELYTALGLDADGTLNLGAFEFAGSTMTTTDSSPIVIDQATTISSDLTVGGDILPSVNLGGNLGSATQQWRSLYVSSNTIYLNNVPITLDSSNNLKVNGTVVGAGGGGAADTGNIVFDSSSIYTTSTTDWTYLSNGNALNEDDTAGIRIPPYSSENQTLTVSNFTTGGDVRIGNSGGWWYFKPDGTTLFPSGLEFSSGMGDVITASGALVINNNVPIAEGDAVGSSFGLFDGSVSLSVKSDSDPTQSLQWNFSGDGTTTFPDGTTTTGATINAPGSNGSQLFTITTITIETPFTNPIIHLSGTQNFANATEIVISGVSNPSQVNGTWYTQSYNSTGIRIYSDSGLTSTPDASSWAGYTGGGIVSSPTTTVGYAIKTSQGSKIWTFNPNGTLSFPDSTQQATAWNPTRTPPAHSYGATGDKLGMTAFDGSYIYYCKADYVNNSTNIWVRVAWTGTSW